MFPNRSRMIPDEDNRLIPNVEIIVENPDANLNDNSKLRPNSQYSKNSPSISNRIFDGISLLKSSSIEINHQLIGTDRSIDNCESIYSVNIEQELTIGIPAIESHSVAMGEDESLPINGIISSDVSPNSCAKRKLIDGPISCEDRPYFPPYGSDSELKGAKNKIDRSTQVYFWELQPPPKRHRKHSEKSKSIIMKAIDSISTSKSAPKVQNHLKYRRLRFANILDGSALDVPSYKPKILLPQPVLWSPYGRPYAEHGQKMKRSDFISSVISSVIDLVHQKPSCSTSRMNRSPPECARHIEFSGFRKSRNWFSFYSHPYYRPQKFGSDKKHRRIEREENVKKKQRFASVKTSALVQLELLKKYPVAIRLGKSKIHGVGVFANEDIIEGQYIVEYIGEIIRAELVQKREDYYRSKGLGSYMFKVDETRTIDATMKGGMARFINHSCDPNCTSTLITCNSKDERHIVLLASKKICKGDELSYNYRWPKEKEKIPCLCGTNNCRRYLN